jgi:oligopeptidase B
MRYWLEHHNDRFVILTDLNAPNFRVMTASVGQRDPDKWLEIVPHQKHVMITELEVLDKYLGIFAISRGLGRIWFYEFGTGKLNPLVFPNRSGTLASYNYLGRNRSKLKFMHTSFTDPWALYEADPVSEKVFLIDQTEIPGYNSQEFITEYVWAESFDGVSIPISLVYKKDRDSKRPQPLYLYAYGAYGITQEPIFDAIRLPLLKRGVVYAVAHVRGGGEFGQEWHDSARKSRKITSARDLISCAEHLIASGYTSSNRLIVAGESAGGFTVAAALNMSRELFAGAILRNPFVDILTAMTDSSIPQTVLEYEEWGNPDIPEELEALKLYCPYINLSNKCYPPMLVLAAVNDPRVPYWMPVKWGLKLQSLSACENAVLLHISRGGHFRSGDMYDALWQIALEWLFLLETAATDSEINVA